MTFRAVSASTVVVEWTPADGNATGFQIDRTYGVFWETVTTLPSDARSYEQAGLAPNSPVCLRVLAVHDFYQQGSTVCGHSLLPALPPLAPDETDLTDRTETGVTVTWTDSSGAAEYIVDLMAGDEVIRREVVPGWRRSYRFEGVYGERGIRVTRRHPEHELPEDLGPPTEHFNGPVPSVRVSASCGSERFFEIDMEWFDQYTFYFNGRLALTVGRSMTWYATSVRRSETCSGRVTAWM